MVELDQNKVYLHVLYELRLLQKLELLKVFWKLDLILQGKSLIQKSNFWNRSKFLKFFSNAPSKINEKLNRSTIWCHAWPKGFVKFFVFHKFFVGFNLEGKRLIQKSNLWIIENDQNLFRTHQAKLIKN